MDPSVLGTGSCPKNIGKFGGALNLPLPDSQEEYNTLHPMLALIHYRCFQPFSLVHSPFPRFQSSVVDIPVDLLSFINVLTPILSVSLSEFLTLLLSQLLSPDLLQHYPL